METLQGKDSSAIRDNISSETSNVDWAKLLLDENTDDRVINVSREKIAHELIRLKNDKTNLEKQLKENKIKQTLGSSGFRDATDYRSTSQSQKKPSNSNIYSNNKLSLLGHKNAPASLTPMKTRTIDLKNYSSDSGMRKPRMPQSSFEIQL